MWKRKCKYRDIFLRWILLVTKLHKLELYLRNQHLKSIRTIAPENKSFTSSLLFAGTKKCMAGSTEYSGGADGAGHKEWQGKRTRI